jgi:hypothetical protein
MFLAFASLLKISDGRFPCRTHSAYYLAQHEMKADSPDGALLESDSYGEKNELLLIRQSIFNFFLVEFFFENYLAE